MVNALTTLGVPLHPEPSQAYAEFRETLPDGSIERTLQWVLLDESSDGTKTQELIRRWHDAEWIAANPTSEIAVARVLSDNFARLAARVREQVARCVYRRGGRQVHVPANWPEAKHRDAVAALEREEAA